MSEMNERVAASIVLAAGKGSRMVGFSGNKTLLPLVPRESPFEGAQPMLLEVLGNLPPGPRAVVVHHCADDVKRVTSDSGVEYIEQPVTNGTGGALLVSRGFIESREVERWIITMGDVPLIRPETYAALIEKLDGFEMVLLGFVPGDRAQYGVIELDGDRVLRIVEWKYWSTYSEERLAGLRVCNAGVYAVRRGTLLRYLDRLARRPHRVRKQRGGDWVTIEEFFLTDLVELMSQDTLPVGLVVCDAGEVVGVDTPEALRFVQDRYALRGAPSPSEARPQ